MTIDTFIPGINVQTEPLGNGSGELQLRRLDQSDGFSTGRERYMLWLIDNKGLTITAFCRQYADKLSKEEYDSLIKQIHSADDFQRLAEEYEDKYSAQSNRG